MKEIAYILTYRLTVLTFALALSMLFSSVVHAQVTLRTSPSEKNIGTKIGTIVDSRAYVFSEVESNIGTVVFSVTFTLNAFGRDMDVPLSVVREKETEIAENAIGYTIEDREGNVVSSGYDAALLLPHEPETSGTSTLLRLGEPQTFTLIAAYSDTPIIDREDRLRISTLPLLASDGILVDLNRSELQDLKTKFTSLEN